MTESMTGLHTEETVCQVLASRYHLTVTGIARQPIGQVTINYRAQLDDGRQVFVKTYPPGARLDDERGAITLSQTALAAGVPGPRVLPSTSRDVIDTSGPLALSVWEWMPGRVVPRPSPHQLQAAGDALGRIHRTFAGLPAGPSAGRAASPAVAGWRAGLERLGPAIDQLLALIDRRFRDGIDDAFDAQARTTLLERRDLMLPLIPGLLDSIPPQLTVQLLHGDYSPVNLLFAGDHLSAVLDYQPPKPRLLAYDLGRAAFYPHTVSSGDHWPLAAEVFVAAYRDANPGVPAADVRVCGRIALLQLLTSLYGVKQHYLKPGLYQDDLDDFWLLRHRAATILLDGLDVADALLADQAAR